VCAIAAGTVANAAPPAYRAHVFPRLEGFDSAIPFAMGASGDIVGYAAPKPFHPQSIAVVAQGDDLVALRYSFDSFNQALAVNADGLIVGMGGFAPSRWEGGMEMRLAALPGYFNGAAWSVNDDGLICGNFVNDFLGFDVPCFWPEPDAEPMQLLGLGGAEAGAAFGVNSSGVIAGYSGGHAVRWDDLLEPPVQIGPLPGGVGGEARAINQHDDVVGRSTFPDFSVHAWLHVRATGVLTDLGHLGGNYSEALALSHLLHVVGVSSTGTEAHGFLWVDGVMHDLNDLVIASSEPYLYVSRAVAIDASDRIAAEVVVGEVPDGTRRIALLEPCTFGDVDCDGVVGFRDLLLVLAAWGPCPGCPEDADGDGVVGFGDLLLVLAAWG
jgi:probable HAF family extracellular repeat protein